MTRTCYGPKFPRNPKGLISETKGLIKTFEYRGLVFKMYNTGMTLVVKQGRRIVTRYFWKSYYVDEQIKQVHDEIEAIKAGIERGFGLNIDWDKVQEAEA